MVNLWTLHLWNSGVFLDFQEHFFWLYLSHFPKYENIPFLFNVDDMWKINSGSITSNSRFISNSCAVLSRSIFTRKDQIWSVDTSVLLRNMFYCFIPQDMNSLLSYNWRLKKKHMLVNQISAFFFFHSREVASLSYLPIRKKRTWQKVYLSWLYEANRMQKSNTGPAEKSVPLKSIKIHLLNPFFIPSSGDFSQLTPWEPWCS